MTALADPPRTKKGPQTVLGGLPQVNLLPPEVRAARGLRNLKRWLAMALVLVLVLCAAVFALAKFTKMAADDDLASAQSETQRLQKEQQKYAEVPRVLSALQNVTTDPAVCAAVTRLGIHYVVEDPELLWGGSPDAAPYTGFHLAVQQRVLTPVAHVGSAGLYRIRDCTP